MSTIVFIDTRGDKLPKAALEAVTFASQLAGGPVTAVTFGPAQDWKPLVRRVPERWWWPAVNALDGQQLTKLVTSVAEAEGAKTIVCVHDGTGKAVAPAWPPG